MNRNKGSLSGRLFCLFFLSFLIIFPAKGEYQPGSRIIDYTTTIRINNGSLEETKSFLIEITDKDSEWISDIKILFSKDNKPDIIEAVVLNAYGKIIRKLKDKEINTISYISSGSFFEDNFITEFSLRGIEYPYTIRYSYKTVYNSFVNISNWIPMPYTNVYTERAKLTVDIPSDYGIKIKSSGNFEYKKDSLNGRYFMSWGISNLPPIDDEILMPSIGEIVPSVRIVPETFTYGLQGRLESWRSFGEWVDRLNRGLTELPQSEKQKIDYLITGLTNNREIVRILYHYLQDHTRYINVSIDIGGLKPYPASYVSTNKYGDCKALTIFMKALLEYAGITSFYTLVSAGKNPKFIDTDYPSQQFNHVILCVPLEKDTVWLENTSSYLPFNYLGTFTQNRYGLMINGEKSALVRTPAMKTEELSETTKLIARLNSFGSGKIVMEKELKGDKYEKYLYLKYQMTEPELKEVIEDDLIPVNGELTSWRVTRDNRDQPSLKAELELSVSEQVRHVGNIIVLNSFPLNISDFEKPGIRKYPVRIFYPICNNDLIVYDIFIPELYEAVLPDNVTIENPCGYYKVKYFFDGTNICMAREYQFNNNEYSLVEYPDFYKFLEDIRKAERESNITINKLKK